MKTKQPGTSPAASRRYPTGTSLDDERDLLRDLQVHQLVETPVDLEEVRGLPSRDRLLNERNVLRSRLRDLDLDGAPPLEQVGCLGIRQRLLMRRIVLDQRIEVVVVL